MCTSVIDYMRNLLSVGFVWMLCLTCIRQATKLDAFVPRERRCHCLMVVCCCHCCRRTDKDNGEAPPYARMGELFSQV